MDDGSSEIFVGHEGCPKCGSRNNLGRWADGHAFCFGCGHKEEADGVEREAKKSTASGNLLDLMCTSWAPDAKLRGCIEIQTMKRFGYRYGKHRGGNCQIAVYRDEGGEPVAAKLRFKDKGRHLNDGSAYFPWVGQSKGVAFFGAHLWGSGKKLVITEGELDAMAVCQTLDLKWPTVSLSGGAGAQTVKSVLSQMPYLLGFQEIILMFDNDEPGRKAAQDVAAALYSNIKVSIAPPIGDYCDACDALADGRQSLIWKAFLDAKPYVPSGITMMSSLRDKVWNKSDQDGVPWPYPALTRATNGARDGELITVTAGSGVGKSELVSECLYYWYEVERKKCAVMFLEDPDVRAAERLVGRHLKKRLNLSARLDTAPDDQEPFDGRWVSKAEFDKAWDHLFEGDRDLPMCTEFGFNDPDALIGQIKYYAAVKECKVIILDHISIVVSGMADGDNERKTLDLMMSRLKKAAVDLNITIVIVSHLSRPSGDKGFELGLEPTANHLRGSHAIVQLSDIIVAMSRNLMDEEHRNRVTVSVLKNRPVGITGKVCDLWYDEETGILKDHPIVEPIGPAIHKMDEDDELPF